MLKNNTFLVIKRLLNLFTPILISQLSVILISTIIIIISGRYNVTDLAAVSLGIGIWVPMQLFGLGLLIAITPLVAYQYGSGSLNKIGHFVKQGFWACMILSVILGLVLFNADKILIYMKLNDILFNKTYSFLKINILGLPGFLLFINFRSFNDGIAKTKPTMVIMLIGLVFSYILSYICINGLFNLPFSGSTGAAIAFTITNWFLLIMALIYIKINPYYKKLHILENFFEKPDPITLKKIFKLGIPLGLALCIESSTFDIIGLLVAHLGEIVVASNQIAMTINSFIFSIPLSIGMASTIIISQALGDRNIILAKKTFYLSICSGILIALFTSGLIMIFRENIAKIFVTENLEVIKITTSLLSIMVFLHCFDAIQVITSCTLRAFKDTTTILAITICCYWGIGLTLGYILALTDLIVPKMGVIGFWYGFICGFICSSILLNIRMQQIFAYPKDKLFRLLNR